jgi:hypothetical protein
MPVLFHLCPEPLLAPHVTTDEGVVAFVGHLFLLPLHWVLLGPVLVHLARVDAAPPDAQLVLTQLALQAPLLGVGTTSVVLQTSL